MGITNGLACSVWYYKLTLPAVSPMLLVIPVSLSDSHLIPFVERAFEINPPGSGHSLLVVGSPNVMKEVAELAQKLCIYFAGNAKTHIFETDVFLGWPTACNYYLQQVAFYLPSIMSPEASWLWFELDTTPLKAGWLDDIESACINVRALAMREEWALPKFFGVRERTYQEFRGELSPPEIAGEHMAAVGVYPADMSNWLITLRTISATNIPWYSFIQWYVLDWLHELKLIQNNWKTNSYEHDPDGAIICRSEANWAWNVHFNKPINPGVVLLHGCKDGSLTELLKAEHDLLQAESAAPNEYWTDYHEEEPDAPHPAESKKKRISKSEITAARQRLLKMHEARRA